MVARRWWGYVLWAALASTIAGPALAQKDPQSGQAQPAPEKAKTGASTDKRELSPAAHNALARLHALNLARATYAKVGAEMAWDENVKTFLSERARDYEQSNLRLTAFAATYGVDMNSDAMQRKTKKTLEQWAKENDKLRNASSEQATRMALTTFISRNNQAIADLRRLRGEVRESELRELINQRIAALEAESTRAQELRQQGKQPPLGAKEQ